MMTLPEPLNNFMQGQKLDSLKPFALLFRNKWDSVNNKFALEDTPIDISDLIAKPNTLSMTLDVNEVAQYNANNVTLTLRDTKNYFVEGTPNSYFPEGYQIYGSRVVLYYGTDGVNRTPLFTGVIKELPTHKPENYQVDVKLVSPLAMLKDIEAKDFSNKVTGETLTYLEDDDDGHKIYQTTGTGVGGFDAVYADGNKLFEGVDYETDQLNALGLPAKVTIINSDYYAATITADYYTWKTGLTVEQIVSGLVGLAGYDSGTEDITPVSWNTAVRNPPIDTPMFAGIGYYQTGERQYTFNWRPTRNNDWTFTTAGACTNKLPDNWDYSFISQINNEAGYSNPSLGVTIISIGNRYNSNVIPGSEVGILYNLGVVGVSDGVSIRILYFKDGSGFFPTVLIRKILVHKITNGTPTLLADYNIAGSVTASTITTGQITVSRRGNILTVYKDGVQLASTTATDQMNYLFQGEHRPVGSSGDVKDFWVYNQTWNIYDTNQRLYVGSITNPCFISDICDKTVNGERWGAVSATLNGEARSFLDVYFSDDMNTWTGPLSYDLDIITSRGERYLYYVLGIKSGPQTSFSLENPTTFFYATDLVLSFVNLTSLTVLEALQDVALISGYEFGVNRKGVFFFRPRVASTTPTYVLDHSEIVKVDTVKKNLSDFFTKLTLTFAQVPLEFYANTGERPTPVDRYGIINKEIDKPNIVNYDNPELAQAIGPQLLEVYSALPNVIQVTGKLNLALELGDIVSLRRNMNLITPEEYTDYSKYEDLNTYYRACKITGLNYNFSKKQITYTLRDVSNKNTEPQYEFNEYIYEHQLQFGVKE